MRFLGTGDGLPGFTHRVSALELAYQLRLASVARASRAVLPLEFRGLGRTAAGFSFTTEDSVRSE